MRNIISVVSGLIVMSVVIVLFTFTVLKLNMEPYAGFARGNISSSIIKEAETIVYINISVILIGVFIASFVVAIIAKNMELLMAVVSIMPIVIIFIDKQIYSLVLIIGSLVFCLVGVKLGKIYKLKRGR